MSVSLSEWHQKQSCVWCTKEKECVTVDFEDGFLQQTTVCWGCLQTMVRVRSQQSKDGKRSVKSTARDS